MQDRQEKLLQLIVENFLETAEPVGSKFLAALEDMDVSGATIRNEMRELEENGFLTHPHTSAGRMPTEKGYRYYVENIMKTSVPSKKTQESFDHIFALTERERQLKELGKKIAEYLNSAVIIAINENSVYYTGISNIIAQVEFQDHVQAVDVSEMFDECEEKMDELIGLIQIQETKILIGNENPLGTVCSTVAIRFGEDSLFAILGPMRMDYARAKGILNYISKII